MRGSTRSCCIYATISARKRVEFTSVCRKTAIISSSLLSRILRMTWIPSTHVLFASSKKVYTLYHTTESRGRREKILGTFCSPLGVLLLQKEEIGDDLRG